MVFRGISKDGGSHPICSTYGIGAYPTYILIAPDYEIVVQDIWPINNATTFTNIFINNGLSPATCYPLAAAFGADETELCVGNPVGFNDMSEGVPITWNWTFEGGNPATSTETNPSVSYDTDGTYDVELTVHDGVFTTTTLMEDYITVSAYPNTTLAPFELACVQWTELELTGGLPEGGVYSGEFVDNGMFQPANAGIGDHTVIYSYTNAEGCEASAEETLTVDACIGINESSVNSIKIYPNPATELLNLNSDSKIINIQVFNHLGQLLIEKNIGGNSCQLNTSEFDSGIYSIRIKTEHGFLLRQFIIK